MTLCLCPCVACAARLAFFFKTVLNSFLRCVRPFCHCWCLPFSAGHAAFLFICLPCDLFTFVSVWAAVSASALQSFTRASQLWTLDCSALQSFTFVSQLWAACRLQSFTCVSLRLHLSPSSGRRKL